MESKYDGEHRLRMQAEEERQDITERQERSRDMLRDNARELIEA